MTCKCGHHFCWLCMGDWKKHGSETGGYYACNIYEAGKTKKVKDMEDKIQSAKDELNNYLWHFERYQNHKNSIKYAKEMESKIDGIIEEL